MRDGRILVRGHDHFQFDEVGSHFVLGAGARLPIRIVTAEAKMNVGFARGQEGFPSEWLPSLTASTGFLALGDHLVISFEQRWFRVPRWEKYFTAQEWTGRPPESKPAGAATQWEWQRFRAFMVGFRY